MRKLLTILMNDRTDRHNERMELSVLESARDQTNARIMGSHYEHDYRYPPIARVAEAFIENEDGVNNLYGEVEFFEVEDIGKEYEIENKVLTIHEDCDFSVSYDRSYKISGLQADVEELQDLISNNPAGFEIKKAVEPVSTLTIFLGLVTFVGATFVSGILTKAGADFWDKLNDIIGKNSKIDTQEKIYAFIGVVEKEYYKVEIIINFTNPTNVNFEQVFRESTQIIDNKINEYYEKSIRARRIVFNFYGERIVHEYSVYKSGLPFEIRDHEAYERLIKTVKQKIKY